jgi:hypothetical protein
MGSYKLRTYADEIDNLVEIFESVEMWRSTTGLVADRVLFDTTALVADKELYEFDDTDGQDSYVAWFRYHHDTGPVNSAFSEPLQYGTSDVWYIGLSDIRDEGITVAQLSDDRAVKLMRMAQSFIDDCTGRHFLPEAKTLKVDSEEMRMLVLPEAIVKIDSIELEELVSGSTPTTTSFDVNTLRVYNRHLTQRLLRPDDREFPRVFMTPEFWPEWRWLGQWQETRQQIKVVGVFGYTELRPSDAAGETSDGSQVPLNWGRCPPMIEDVMMRLIVRWMAPHGDPDYRRHDEAFGKMKSWKTDRQSVTYHAPTELGVPVFTGDFDIDSVLYRYSKDYRPQVVVI